MRGSASPSCSGSTPGGDAALGEGATPFLRAAKTSDCRMMRLLREHGADPALTTKNQTTAVMFAAGPSAEASEAASRCRMRTRSQR